MTIVYQYISNPTTNINYIDYSTVTLSLTTPMEYFAISLEEGDKLFAHYHVNNLDNQTDRDVLEDYKVWQHETGAYIVEYVSTGYCYGSYKTLGAALEALRAIVNKKEVIEKKIGAEVVKFQEVVKKTSLDERYKNFKPSNKPLTNEQLKHKYGYVGLRRTDEQHMLNEEKRAERNNKLSDADYADRLVNH